MAEADHHQRRAIQDRLLWETSLIFDFSGKYSCGFTG
jgi:hypothetical protein